jgi:hypothetical protein
VKLSYGRVLLLTELAVLSYRGMGYLGFRVSILPRPLHPLELLQTGYDEDLLETERVTLHR